MGKDYQVSVSISKLVDQLLSSFEKERFKGPGLIIAILGSDGSGKSTQLRKLSKLLSKKTDVMEMYMGSGSGPSGIIRSIFGKIKKYGQTGKKLKNSKFSASQDSRQNKSILKKIFNISWASFLAWEKKKKLRKAYLARKKGYIVICDRYPQTVINSFNDGPKLQKYATSCNWYLRSLARWEFNCYTGTKETNPDLVVKLIGDVDVIKSRRPDMNLQTIIKKQNAIKKIAIAESTYHVEVNSCKPINDVTSDILHSISKVIINK